MHKKKRITIKKKENNQSNNKHDSESEIEDNQTEDCT